MLSNITLEETMILDINESVNEEVLRFNDWEFYFDFLFKGREYQKEATHTLLKYFISNKYKNLEELMQENYYEKKDLRAIFPSFEMYKKQAIFSKMKYATLDIATGTGKSYIMFGIAVYMICMGFVDRVILLCPSLTIEYELTKKFNELISDKELSSLIPSRCNYKGIKVQNADYTVDEQTICIENVHAIYENTSSSIRDSLNNIDIKTLVINDEAHHLYNSYGDSSIKKWSKFILDNSSNIDYVVGLTGTAYKDNRYFVDIVYRFSLKEAIDKRYVKKIRYVVNDEGNDKSEKLQKIYQNHIDNKKLYSKVKPITIIVTKDIKSAKVVCEQLKGFLAKRVKNIDVDELVTIVTSDKEHRRNVENLKYVDFKDNKVEWIVSVSMLTEGWDVKNVFQIVPWEDRAFNSKLLVAQVLGRGLRVPYEYIEDVPVVTVYNHDSWSEKIQLIVNQILSIDNEIISEVDKNSIYNFDVSQLDYKKELDSQVIYKSPSKFNYEKAFTKGISLVSQSLISEKSVEYKTVGKNLATYKINYTIRKQSYPIEEIAEKIISELKRRNYEGKIIKLGDCQYSKENLPSKDIILKLIKTSMKKSGIYGDELTFDNRNRILNSFNTLLRKSSKTVIYKRVQGDLYKINTTQIMNEKLSVNALMNKQHIFYPDNYETTLDIDTKSILKSLIEQGEVPIKALNLINRHCFKTPLKLVISQSEPERKFISLITKENMSKNIDSWIKSRNMNFYSIPYILKFDDKIKEATFNPDFIIKLSERNKEIILVIEIKADDDITIKNKLKQEYAFEHFNNINKLLNDNIEYRFILLSPSSYDDFESFIINKSFFEKGTNFNSKIMLDLLDL